MLLVSKVTNLAKSHAGHPCDPLQPITGHPGKGAEKVGGPEGTKER